MSGIWLRCPNCDLEVKVETLMLVVDGNLGIDYDFATVAEHARNCEERKHG
jgi:hypothetical protein